MIPTNEGGSHYVISINESKSIRTRELLTGAKIPNPVVHFEVHGTDQAKLEAFYRNLSNWHVNHNDEMKYGEVDTHAEGGINGGISQVTDQSPPGRVIVYVQVGDLDGYLKKSESLGGKTIAPVMEIPNVVTFAITSDPEGNWVGLVKEWTM